MTEDLGNERYEATLRRTLHEAVDEVSPSTDALTTIRARIDRGEGRMSALRRVRAGIGDATGRLLGRSRPGRSATISPGGAALAADDYVVSGSSGPGRARSRGRRAVMAVAGVFAVLTTGLAVNQLTVADGAGSPEAAVRDFFDAIDQEDPLGVLESLSPSEREVLVPSVRRLAEQLETFDVADDGLDLEHVDGLDLEVSDLELRTQGLHPDVAAVKVTGGTIATSANFRELPLGKALVAALEGAGGRDLDEPVSDSIPLDLTLVTVQTDGRWHVSLMYSVAENMRANKGAPVPAFGNGIPANGADSPEEAVDAMVAAFNEQDFTGMIELTPLDSAAVLHDYGPVLLDEGDGSSTTVLEDVRLGDPRGSGDRRTLTVEAYRMVSSYEGDYSMTSVYDGSCLTTTYAAAPGEESSLPSEPETQCADDTPAPFAFGFGLAPLSLLMFGPGPAQIEVVEHDGAWFVDPALSAVSILLADIAAASPEQMDQAVEQWAAIFNSDEDAWYATIGPEYYDYCPDVPAPSADASFEERKAAGQRCINDQSAGSSSEAGGTTPTTTVDGDAADGRSRLFDAFARCQEQGDPAAVEACVQGLGDAEILALHHTMACKASGVTSEIEVCLQGLVDEGEIDPVEVARYRCMSRYEALGEDDAEAYDEAYQRCMADAGFGVASDSGSSDSEEDEVGATTTVSTPN